MTKPNWVGQQLTYQDSAGDFVPYGVTTNATLQTFGADGSEHTDETQNDNTGFGALDGYFGVLGGLFGLHQAGGLTYSVSPVSGAPQQVKIAIQDYGIGTSYPAVPFSGLTFSGPTTDAPIISAAITYDTVGGFSVNPDGSSSRLSLSASQLKLNFDGLTIQPGQELDVLVTFAPDGVTAGNGSLNAIVGQNTDLTAYIQSLLSGPSNDPGTVTSISEAGPAMPVYASGQVDFYQDGGAVSLSNGVIIYTSQNRAEDTLFYTAVGALGDTSSGTVTVSADTGAEYTGTVIIGRGVTQDITQAIQSALPAGNVLTSVSDVTGSSGSVALTSANGAITDVEYTNIGTNPIATQSDTIAYAYKDKNNVSNTAAFSVINDPGFQVQTGAATIGHSQTDLTATLLADVVRPSNFIGEAATYSLVSASSNNGSVQVNGGTLMFTPLAGGQATITYMVQDQYGGTGTGTFYATIDSGPKTGKGTQDLGNGQTFDLTSYIASLISPGLSGEVDTITAVSAAKGSAVLSATANGPAVGYTAPSSGTSDTLNYTVQDQYGDRSTGAVTITLSPKLAAENGTIDLNANTVFGSLSGYILDNFVYPDARTYSGGYVFINSITGINISDTPSAGYSYKAPTSGMDSFTYQAGFTASGATSTTFATGTITVIVNPGPVNLTFSQTIVHGQTENLSAYLPTLFSNKEPGDTAIVTGATGSAVTAGAGQFNYTAPANGSASVGFTVKDQFGNTDNGTLQITVEPGPSVKSGQLTIGKEQSEDVTAYLKSLIAPGLSGDNETITAVTGSANLANGVVTYTAPLVSATGMDSFGYTVQDQYGDTATGSVAVTINRTPLPSHVIAMGDYGNLFVTDGTAAGSTTLSSPVDGDFQDLTAFGSRALFDWDNGQDGGDLYVTDGTSAGTVKLNVANASPFGLAPQDITVFGSNALFEGIDGGGGKGLWITDGTSAGSAELASYGSASSGLAPQDITAFGKRALFEGPTSTGGSGGLFITDGTSAGTLKLTALNSLVGVASITVLGAKAVFEGLDNFGNDGLWVTDGTTFGTTELLPSRAAPDVLAPQDITALGNKALFEGSDGYGNEDLWVTDGTLAGTTELLPSGAAPDGLAPQNITVFGTEALFEGTDNNGRTSLWETDGTTSGTYDIGLFFPQLNDITVVGREAFVEGSDYQGNYELWVTGDAGSKELYAGYSEPSDITAVNGEAFFIVDDTLWASDGTLGGTSVVRPFDPISASSIVAFGNKALVNDVDGELWLTDGTTAGTQQLATDLWGGSTLVVLPADPGPSLAQAVPLLAAAHQGVVIGFVTPGLSLDTLKVLAQSGLAGGGTLTLGPVGTNGASPIIYTAPYIVNGLAPATITYTVGDEMGDVVTGSATVAFANLPQYAPASSVAATVTPAASATVSNGNTATLALVTPGYGTDKLSVSLASDAVFFSGSKVSLDQTGHVIYTPGLITMADVGPDTVTYRVTDTVTGASTSITQSITLGMPAAPVVTQVYNYAPVQNGGSIILATATPGFATDGLEAYLTADAAFSSGSAVAVNSQGDVVYGPGIVTPAKVGADTISYVVVDAATGASTTETQTIVLSNAPGPSVALASATPTAIPGALTYLGKATPIYGGDAMTISLTKDAAFTSGSALSLDASGNIFYAPGAITASKVGRDTVSYTVTDSVTGVSTSETQTVNLINDFTVTPASLLSVANGQAVTLGTVTPLRSGDPLTVSLVSDAAFPSGSSVRLDANGNVIYTPGLITAAKAGSDTVTYVVTDSATKTSGQVVQSVLLNDGPAPVVTEAAAIPVLLSGQTAILGKAVAGFGADQFSVTLTSDVIFTSGSVINLDSQGNLIYTPGGPITAAKSGLDSIGVTVTDQTTGASLSTYLVAFINPGVNPTITGINTATEATTSEASVQPFSTVTVSDSNNGGSNRDTLTITQTGTGALSGTGLVAGSGGTYTLTGTAATITSELDALTFKPAAGAPNTSQSTSFTVTDSDATTTGTVSATSAAITVTNADPAVAPTISGVKTTTQQTTSETPVTPFSTVTIADPNNGGSNSDTLTITQTGTGALSGAGLAVGSGGIYTLTGTAATITSNLEALTFTPASGAPNTSHSTSFNLGDSDATTGTVSPTSAAITVTDADPSVAPTIIDLNAATGATTSEAPVTPFSTVTVSDANNGGSNSGTLTIKQTGTGTLSGTGLAAGAGGTYTLTGTAVTITAELDALTFKPAAGVPNTSHSTSFTLSDGDASTGTVSATSAVVTITDTDPAVAPTIPGVTTTTQQTTSEAPVTPFSTVIVSDTNNGGSNSDTLTITQTGTGALSGTGLVAGSGGTYTLTGTAATVTSELDALTFKPTAGAPNTSQSTSFTLSDIDTTTGTVSATSAAITVTNADPAVAPTITGVKTTTQQTTSEAPVTPFSTVTISDTNNGGSNSDTLTIMQTGTVTGTLSGSGLVAGWGVSYTLTGTAAAITSELDALTFKPAWEVPNTSQTSSFTLSDSDTTVGFFLVSATSAAITVTDTDPAVAPMITGVNSAMRTTTSEAPVTPFTTVTVSDANNVGTNSDTLTITQTGTGTLSGTGLVAGSGGTYMLTGTAAMITSELDALTFKPATGVPETSQSASFTLRDGDAAAGTVSAVTAVVTVTNTDPSVAPTIAGVTTTTQQTTSEAPVTPFSTVTISDTNNGGSNSGTLTITQTGLGALSGTGLVPGSGGTYTLTGTAATVTSELDGLTFKPTAGAPNTARSTSFTLSDSDATAGTTSATSAVVQVVDSDPAVKPTITGVNTATQTTTSEAIVTRSARFQSVIRTMMGWTSTCSPSCRRAPARCRARVSSPVGTGLIR